MRSQKIKKQQMKKNLAPRRSRITATFCISSIVFLAIVLLDQLSKFLMRANFREGEHLKILPFFQLSLVQNTGAGFGILKDMNLFLMLFSIVVLLILLYLYQKEQNLHMRYSMVILAAGIVGNLVDRILIGSVTDFLDFLVWPVFNVADMAISSSVIAMCYFVFFKKED